MEALDLNAAELGDLAKIVPAEIHEHVVLCKFLLVFEEFRFKCLILFIVLSARSCACERECVKDAVLQLYECLRGSTCNLHIRA